MLVLTNPAPPPRRRRAGAARAGDLRLRRPAHARRRLSASRSRRSPACRPRGSSSSVTARSEPSSSASRQPSEGAARVSFVGLRTRDEALRIVAGAEAGLLSSDWENLPALGGRGAVGRRPGRRDGGRRRARGRARRRERPARAAGRPGAAGRRDPARSRGARPARPARCGGEAVRRGPVERRRLRPARGAACWRPRDDASARASSSSAARATGCRCRPGWRRSGTRSRSSSTTASSGPPTGDSPPSDDRFRLSQSRAAAAARRPPLLPPPAAAAAAADPELPSRRDLRVRSRSSARLRSPGRALARRPRAGDRRGARRLADVHAPLRLAGAPADQPARGRGRRRTPSDRRTRRGPSRASPPASSRRSRGVPPSAVFTAYSDLSAFAEREPVAAARATDALLRRRARGVQERRGARRRLAERRGGVACGALLVIVGSGSQRRRGRRARGGLPGPRRAPRVARARGRLRALDASTVLVLPSFPEGLGRVIIESFARGRAVVGDRRGRHPRSGHGRGRRAARPAGRLGGACRGPRAGARRQRARRADGERRRECVTGTGTRRPHSSRVTSGRSSRQRSRERRADGAARLRHSDRRRGPPCAGADGRSRARAGRAVRVGHGHLRLGRAGTTCPATSRFRTFGARTRLGRGVRFFAAAAASLLPRATTDAVLVHMVPLFVVLAAPLAKPLRVPVLLWYTHWHAGRSLRLATPLADVVLSVDRGSFPLATPKLRGDRPRDRRRRGSRRPTSRQPRARSAARPGSDGALEGLRHDARGARARHRARPRRRARAPRSRS